MNKIVYLCDKKKCEFACSGDPDYPCRHTADIDHAVNFRKVYEGVYEEIPHGEWIAIKTRKPTEEEVQEYMNDPYFDIDDPADLMFFDCEMPKDGQEVLITTSWGHVCIDTYVHEYGAFEDHEDHEDVVAWMPLPEPYKGGGVK